MAPVVGIGGVLSSEGQWPFYAPLLYTPNSPLKSRERFIHILNGARSGDFAEIYGDAEERFLKIHDRLEQRVVVFGQSFGGLVTTKLGVDHPDKISAAICLAGAQEGVEKMTIAGRVLKHVVGNEAGAADLMRQSEIMCGHIGSIASRWSPHTSLHLISPTVDPLLPCPQGLGLALPEGQKVHKKFIAPLGVPRVILERFFGMPEDADPLYGIPVEHVGIGISPTVRSYSRQVRRNALLSMPPPSVDVATPTPIADYDELPLAA